MQRNQPKYSFFKNAGFAISGVREVYKNESAFKIEVILFTIIQPLLWILDIELYLKIVLFGSLFIPLIAELTNSAIERVVDLVTNEYHILAKQAKDAGSAVVLVANILTAFIWFFTLLFAYKII